MEVKGPWTVQARGGGAKVWPWLLIPFSLLLVGGLVAFAHLNPEGINALGDYMPWVFIPVVLVFMILPFLVMRSRKLQISVHPGLLELRDSKGRCEEISLGGMVQELSKLYLSGNNMFMGSVCTLRSQIENRQLRFFAQGVEFAPEQYDGPDLRNMAYEFGMQPADFRALVEGLEEQALQRTGAKPSRDLPQHGVDEQLFEVLPNANRAVFGMVVIFMGASILLGATGAALTNLFELDKDPAAYQNMMAIISTAAVVLPFGLAFWFYFRRRKHKFYLVLRGDGLRILGAEKKVIHEVNWANTRMERRRWVQSSRYTSTLVGPAFILRNRKGKRFKLGVRDPSLVRNKKLKRVGSVHFELSSDAGKNLLAMMP